MLQSSMIAALLLVGTVMLHYEGLRGLSMLVERRKGASRPTMLLIIFGVVGLHLFEIGLYGAAYAVADGWLHLGGFGGERRFMTVDYLYFAAEAYSNLGLGDIYPLGDLRVIASIEALNGLLLAGWSASFTFLMMQRLWQPEVQCEDVVGPVPKRIADTPAPAGQKHAACASYLPMQPAPSALKSDKRQ